MLTRKPVPLDEASTVTLTAAPRPAIFPPGFQSLPTSSNALITREELARIPVPEGFNTTNLTAINKGALPPRASISGPSFIVLDPRGAAGAVRRGRRQRGGVTILNPYKPYKLLVDEQPGRDHGNPLGNLVPARPAGP